jgi:carbon-monoxide dehydrogenase large subunit
MIIEGQVHGGLTEAFAIAMGQEIKYDEMGNVTTGSFMDFFLPTAVETPHWETDFTRDAVAAPSDRRQGRRRKPERRRRAGFSNAVNDAFSFLRPGADPDAARLLAHLEGRASDLGLHG